MSDTVQEKIAEIVAESIGGEVASNQCLHTAEAILSIVREAVSAVNQDLSDLGNDMYDKGYKAGSRDIKKALMEELK